MTICFRQVENSSHFGFRANFEILTLCEQYKINFCITGTRRIIEKIMEKYHDSFEDVESIVGGHREKANKTQHIRKKKLRGYDIYDSIGRVLEISCKGFIQCRHLGRG